MNWLLISVFSGVCLWLIGAGLARPGKIYEYPFLAGTTFLGFVLPQLPSLADDPFLPDGAFTKTASFTILCVAACGLGWRAGNQQMTILRWTLDERRLLWIAGLLSVAGAFFYFKLSRLPKEVVNASQWSGASVMYIFFARMLTYGFAIALLCFMRRLNKVALGIALFGATLILDRVIIAGRKGEITEIALLVLLAAWFDRRVAAPRVAALAGALAAALALSSTGDYREISQGDIKDKWSQLTKIDVLGNFRNLLKNGGPELRNATLRINATDKSFIFDYGLFHWNVLVFNFVPAQIVGTEFKRSLRVEVPGEDDPDYMPPTGSTETGMADAFASFWYFGAVKFLMIGYTLSRIYRSAMAGSAAAQLLYMLSVVPAMHAITHHTQWVLSAWASMTLLLLPFVAFSRVRAWDSRPRAARAIEAPQHSLSHLHGG